MRGRRRPGTGAPRSPQNALANPRSLYPQSSDKSRKAYEHRLRCAAYHCLFLMQVFGECGYCMGVSVSGHTNLLSCIPSALRQLSPSCSVPYCVELYVWGISLRRPGGAAPRARSPGAARGPGLQAIRQRLSKERKWAQKWAHAQVLRRTARPKPGEGRGHVACYRGAGSRRLNPDPTG